jgi:hypothetical protein
MHFLIKSDNQGIIHAIECGRSRNSEQNRVLQQITSLFGQHSIWISSLHVAFLDNLADPLSCGLPVHSRFQTISIFTLPIALLPFLIHS